MYAYYLLTRYGYKNLISSAFSTLASACRYCSLNVLAKQYKEELSKTVCELKLCGRQTAPSKVMNCFALFGFEMFLTAHSFITKHAGHALLTSFCVR